MTPDSEFAFELRTCRWAEREWPPDRGHGHDDTHHIVARQLGTKRRRWDTIVLECDPTGLRNRARFGAKRLDSDLLHIVRNAPTEWAYYRDALPHPGYPWRYVREAIHQADDRGILEMRKQGNRIQIRRKWPYPDWIERIIAIENKPDLDASAARALGPQLEFDVALALADEVWVATQATDETITPALFEGLPVAAGILTLDPDALTAEVAWHPRQLAVDEPGTRILERPDGGERDGSAARFEYVEPETKAEKRLALAERAYERGWRSFVETMRPDCRHFELRAREGPQLVPYCSAKACQPTAAECSGSCPEFEPEPPVWRTKDWPIEGGPGKRLQRLLAKRRRRRRPGQNAGGCD
ncbi:uncharacterized protein Nmag_2757 [Natrialba magadii ATCC 43099]|uniref:Uncharacterized protein n=1 Tax=Natrialba magadii (strain ATCC 43099 / DSM 3394 / CCM 3739 / CIP 104546 / IAM 13178 / JCM 8861 / NBRC 102185 / NCIMB 2190 / MS3) TaxID=547559 RepID=D3SZQ3_NATMM|nr:DUF5787 family protein [Natrialba magadii]ADD06313.1 uncharacterized protein Nmag_2757 [Natrialba magadii ATCC 43099]ELY31250.1 hypothetical protein C500_06601 [Natrialba magadii ATCC 43099]